MSTDWRSDVLIHPYVQEKIEDLLLPGATLDYYGSGLSTEEIEQICTDLDSATCYLIDFANDRTDLDTALDAVEQATSNHGLSMDDVVNTAIDNLEYFLSNPYDCLE